MVYKPKLTEEQKVEIRAKKSADPKITNAALAKEYGVDASLISRLVAAPPAAEANARPAVTLPTDQIVGAEHRHIHRSSLNPRKRFDEAALEELSQSIEEKGVLQPILVRYANAAGNTPVPGAQPGDLEIIAGERRWRGAGLVIARGALPIDYQMPIRIVDPCDDIELLKLALTENTARNDMTPIEEAEAYGKLSAQGLSAPEIGKIAGRNPRTVQKRLRLISDLTPKVRDAVGAGELSVEFANVLAAYCPKSKQDGTLEEIKRGDHATSSQLKKACLSLKIPESVAFFDTNLYTGEWLVDEENPAFRYFVDAAMFKTLQDQAVQNKLNELQKKYSRVDIHDRAKSGYFDSWNYTTKKGHALARAIIEIASNHQVTVHLDMVLNRDADAKIKTSASGKVSAEADPTTKAHNAHAHRRKTAAMQRAVAADPMMAMRLTCAALLGAEESIRIGAEEIGPDDQVFATEIVNELTKSLEPLFKDQLHFGAHGPRDAEPWSEKRHTKIWSFIHELSDTEVAHLFARLVALRVGTFSGWNPSLGDTPSALQIADSLGLVGNEENARLTLDASDLEGLRKDTLMTTAKMADVRGDYADLKISALKAYIAGQADPKFVLPSLRFGPYAAVNAMIRGAPHPLLVNRMLGTAPEPATKTGLSPGQVEACIVIRDEGEHGISALSVKLKAGCTDADLQGLVNDLVVKCEGENFLSPGMHFPPNAVLAAHAAAATI